MIFRSISAVLVLAISCASQNQNTHHQNKGIEEAAFIELGEIEQWITIRGDNEEAPVLLLLHGGPGDVQSPLIDIYSSYERDFVIVQWDQRGAGKTYEKFKEHTPNLTLSQLISDGIELAEFLRNGLRIMELLFLDIHGVQQLQREWLKNVPTFLQRMLALGKLRVGQNLFNGSSIILKERPGALTTTSCSQSC